MKPLISFRVIKAFALFLCLAGCAGTPAPRDASDGALYARATLDSVYDSATALRRSGRLSDAGKQAVLDAGSQFEMVLQIVEGGGTQDVHHCLALVNNGLKVNGKAPLGAASSCLDAAIQGLTTLRSVLENK
jgi:hypothetical protein